MLNASRNANRHVEYQQPTAAIPCSLIYYAVVSLDALTTTAQTKHRLTLMILSDGNSVDVNAHQLLSEQQV